MVLLKEQSGVAISAGADISYNELVVKSCEYASFLTRYLPAKAADGIGPRAAVISENRPEWLYAHYGIWMNGGVTVPVDFMSTAEEIRYIIDDCRPDAVYVSEKTEAVVREAVLSASHKPAVLEISKSSSPYFGLFEPLDPPSEDVALIIYTSGTTGSPKGVMLTYGNLTSLVEVMLTDKYGKENIMYGPEEVFVVILPFHHIYPLVTTLIMPMAAGSKICLISELTGEAILSCCQKNHVTRIFAVPRVYSLFHTGIMKAVNASAAARFLFSLARLIGSRTFSRLVFGKVHRSFGGSVIALLSGGSKLDPAIARDFETLGFPMLEGYGMTEASPSMTVCNEKNYRIGTVGWTMPCGRMKIVGGEIRYKGPNVMKGYFNRPEETAAVFDEEGFLKTGDRGELGSGGFLTVTGRFKEIIVLPNGKNINPEEIENEILKSFPIIKEIAVTEKEGHLFAVILPYLARISKDGISNISETIRWEVLDRYNIGASHHKKLLDFALVDSELPRTRLGKLKRHELSAVLSSGGNVRTGVEDPQTEEYAVLANIVRDMIGRNVSAGDHIELDLGMDSLDRVELQTRIEKVFGMVLSNDDLSRSPRLFELSALITEGKTKMESEDVDWKTILSAVPQAELPNRSVMISVLLFVLRPFLHSYIRVHCKELSSIPDGSVIFAPNHQSHLDGLILSSVLSRRQRRRTYYFAKDRNFNSPFRRFFARNANIVLININRDLRETVGQMAAALKKGNSAVIFPEGARSRDGSLLPFKKSFSVLSSELNVPVVPVSIKGSYQILPIGKKFPGSGRITITFHSPVFPENKRYEDILQETHCAIEKALED